MATSPKKQYLQGIDRNLNLSNIHSSIETYLLLLKEMELSIHATSIFQLLNRFKRDHVINGPYPGLTLFEASNRIMTDLTILYGVKDMLINGLDGGRLRFDEFLVEFGNENSNGFDIRAVNGQHKLFGEAFNVAESFFPGKKSSSMSKLRNPLNEELNLVAEDDKVLLLVYNAEVTKNKPYVRKEASNVHHLPVVINLPE